MSDFNPLDNLASREAEETIIAGLWKNPSQYIDLLAIVTASDFHFAEPRLLYEALTALIASGKAISRLMIMQHLKVNGTSLIAENGAILERIEGMSVDAGQMLDHARMVRNYAQRRRLFAGAMNVASAASDDTLAFDEVRHVAEQLLLSGLGANYEREAQAASDAVVGHLARVSDVLYGKRDGLSIPTGFCPLDAHIVGMDRGDLVTIMAASGAGKSALGQNILTKVVQAGKHAFFWSGEMSTHLLIDRFVGILTGLNTRTLRTVSFRGLDGEMNKAEWERYKQALETIAKWSLRIDDTPGISVEELAAKVRVFHREKPFDFILIDYIQLMNTTSASRGSSREVYVATVTRQLKQLAGDLDVPVLCLAQINREKDKRKTGARFRLSDLRESAEIGNSSSTVLGLYRPQQDDEDADQNAPHRADVEIVKQRNGETGTIVSLMYHPQRVTFFDLN